MKSKSKKSLKSIIILLSIFISLLFNAGLTTKVFTPNSVSNDSSLDNIEYNNIELNVLVPKITIKTSYSPNGEEFKQLRIHDGGNLAEVGKPRVPFQTVEILLPYGKDMRDIEIFAGNWHILEGYYKIEPAQEQIPIGSSKETDFAFDAMFYQTKNPYPNKMYSVVGIYELRGYRILVVNLYPVKYYPNTGIVSYTKEMSISVNLADSTNINTLYRNQKVDENHVLKSIKNPEVLNSYKGKIVEHNLITPKLALPSGSYDYVIITNNDLKNSAGSYTFQDLAAAKNASGIQTRIVTVEYIYANYLANDKQEQIRNFIIDAYQNWGIEYVLLGGDGDGVYLGGESGDSIIPPRGFYAMAYGEIDYNITSDLYYAALDGNWNTDGDAYWGEPGEDDLYAEVYVGRAPVDSEEELSNFVYKTLTHEVETHPYLSKVLMVGEDLGWYVWGGDYKDEVKDGSSANGYTTVGFPLGYFVDTLYDRDLDPLRWEKEDLMPLINDGIHIINHLGHCDVEYSMKMYNPDADSLTNDLYFFGYSQGCYNGAFDNRGPWGSEHMNDSIIEHFVTTPHGAFAFIGNSRFGWGDPYGTNGASQYYDRQFFDAIFNENIEEIGRANQDSKEDNIGFIDLEAMRWVYYELNLMGDPTAKIPPQPNDFSPTLSDGEITPSMGDQTTLFKYNVSYSDADNNPPVSMNVIINGTSFPMEKEDSLDETYTDGCIYQFFTYLQPGDYNYSFEGADYKFSTNHIEGFGPMVTEKSNNNSPNLTNAQVSPNKGFKDYDLFTFSVVYTDADNNEPEYINVTINSEDYSMVKHDYLDSNFMDGCKYVYKTDFDQLGTNMYSFECSDGSFSDSIGPYFGPEVSIIINYTMLPGYTYDWIDATSGIRCSLDGSDDGSERFDLPFEFQFYNQTFDYFYVCTNGFISFGSETAYWHPPFPTADFPFMIAPFWDDLYADSPCNMYIRYLTDPNRVVIEWLDIYSLDGYLIGSFEVILHESGDIVFNYDYLDNVEDYTCGLNFGLDTRFYNTYYGLNSDTDNFSILFMGMQNNFAPELSLEDVKPKFGYQNTLFNFTVNYQDQDDNYPIWINVVINNTAFPMTKVDFYDNNYTDGCMYQYLTYLPSSIHNYSYYFECYDGKFTYNTLERDNVHVYESNSIGPSLTNGDVNPDTGYRKATIFTFMVSYTDPDNNAPAYINVQIDTDIFPMVKQDYLDSNYMDGCVYIYSTTFDDSSFHNFSFFCSDGIYTDTIGPYFGPSIETGNLFTGMYMNYLFTLDEANSYDTNVSYTFKTGDIFTAAWDLEIMTSTWDINMNDRIMTNVINPVWVPGSHTPFWVHTDITIGDILNITVDGIGDETFIVSNEFYIDYPAVGSVGVWELHGITTPESTAWYEQSTGILLNSTFFYNNGLYNYTLELYDTNAECNLYYLPGNFILNTDAGTPDEDGMFNISWSTSEYAVNYSVYMHSSFMSEIPSGLTPIITETTDRITPITIHANGTYYFIVVAHNNFGDTLSNCRSVEVRIYRDTKAPLIYIIVPESGDEFTTNIPIYEITVTELHLDSVWYSLDGGITNISITSYIGVIDEDAWNALPYEPVIITFYANDTAGNIGSSSVIVYRNPLIPPGIPGPFVVLILTILFTGIIGLSWRQKRKLD